MEIVYNQPEVRVEVALARYQRVAADSMLFGIRVVAHVDQPLTLDQRVAQTEEVVISHQVAAQVGGIGMQVLVRVI